MAIAPPTYTPSGNLFGTTPTTTPYTYGSLAPTTSAYNIWGSTGNPYLVAGPTYTPGSGAPIVPRPIAQPVAPVVSSGGGDSGGDYSDTANTPTNSYGLQDYLKDYNDPTQRGLSYAAGALIPGFGALSALQKLSYGISLNPWAADGDQTYDWYKGDTDYFGNPVTNKFAFDVLDGGASGISVADRGEYDVVSEYGWGSDEHFNSLDTDPTGGYGGGKTASTMTNAWGSPQDPIALEATAAIAADKQRVAANKQAIADAEQAKLDAEQAKWDNQYAQINDLNTQQISLMDDIKTDMQDQYGTFQDEILSQVAAENASMFDNFAEYKQWMGEQFTTQQSGLDEALAQQAAISEGLNSTQIDLMNSIAEDMTNQYGAFTSEVGGQLEQMAAENASMFDSFEEYQQWVSDENMNNAQPGTPADIIHPETGDWTNPAAGVDTSTLGGELGTGSGTSYDSGSNTLSVTTDTGTTDYGVTDYGSGQYGVELDGEQVGYESPDSSSSSSDSGGGSYIATAATQSLGEEGLQVFNNWRDYMSTWHPTFKTSYGRYRVTAPKIVAEIDKKENSKELYKEIWDKWLKPIFELIKEDKDNPKALSDYKVMVKELMNKYLKQE